MKFGAHPISLRQLQYVVAVAEERSFRKAAARCFVSQPSLSAQVAGLERVLGVQLFERARRRFVITAAGHALVERALVVLREVDELVAIAEQHVEPFASPLRLGVIPTIGPYFLPDLDPALRASFEGIQLRWVEAHTERLVALMQRGDLDAAVLALQADLADLEHVALGVDPFVLAGPPSHPLVRKRRRLRPEELSGRPLMLLEDGHCFGDQTLDLCALAGACPSEFRATSLATLAQMAAAVDGTLTVLPRLSLGIENRRGRLKTRAFAQPGPQRTVVLAWRRGSARDETLREIAQVACNAFRAATR